MSGFFLLLSAVPAKRPCIRAWSEQSKYCSTHTEGVSVCADLPVIKEAAGGNSANHHDLQHQVLSGQAARQAEVCLRTRARACALACTRSLVPSPAHDHIASRQAKDPTHSRKVQPVSKHPPGNKKQNYTPSFLPPKPGENCPV